MVIGEATPGNGDRGERGVDGRACACERRQHYLSAWKALATGLHLIFGCISTEKNLQGDGHGGSNKSMINITTRKSALQDVREDYSGRLTSPKMSNAHLEACKEDTTTYKDIHKDPEGHVKGKMGQSGINTLKRMTHCICTEGVRRGNLMIVWITKICFDSRHQQRHMR